MPPRIEPKSLQEISLASVASLTNKLCVDIERKHGGWKSPASRNKLTSVKMYLSTIKPLFQDLFKAIYDLCSMQDKEYLLLELLMCDKIKTLNLSDLEWSHDCFSDSVFWKNQLLKLNNVVEVDISRVRITDEVFQAIGDGCTNLRKICINSDLDFASMESLLHILKCRELQDVRIHFWNWEEKSQMEYTKMILTGLPKLEHFHPFEYCQQWHMGGEMSIATPLTSMRKVHSRLFYTVEVGDIIRLCPNLKDISLVADYHNANGKPDLKEGTKVLKTLAESSLQLDTLRLNGFTFSPEMNRLITSNCTNLTSLDLNGWEGRRISVNDIYTIGVSCPKIEVLRIIESCWAKEERLIYIQIHSPNMEEQTFLTAPRMFVHLKVLFLFSNVDCDQRILPLILRHANDLMDIALCDVFKPTGTSVDLLSELLNANSLPELESLSLEGECYGDGLYMIPLSIASIERLLDCCPKLTQLDLKCPMEYKTIQYLRELQVDMPRQNFDIAIRFEPVLFVNG